MVRPRFKPEIIVDFLKYFLANLKKPIEDAIANYSKVKLVRTPVRVGLIKARMFGCVNAKGPALVFMDAHIEGSFFYFK